MSSLTKRMCIAITSVVVVAAGGAVVGVGGTASAAVPEHVQRPAVGVAADNHRSGGDERNWDRSDYRRSGRDHDYYRDSGHAYRSDRDRDYRRDRGDGHRRDQGTSSSWGDRGGDRDGGSLYNRDRQGSGR
ncbi:hypothetical protein ACWDBO_38980 [Streptomyces mirabilis]|uniref:hypothetical protein n=1 Tax=Streptomyces TaxID=1883 RepID=UPI0029A33952|nr:hypothetical protein [Streptomyces sp. AK02-04a]MDX3762891.1 hypothetical protein [Streptomyces sp. AK02-04a]